MRTRDSLLALIQELEGDAREIQRLLVRNRTAWERIDRFPAVHTDFCTKLRGIADAL